VLVPRLYLASASRDTINAAGATIAANDTITLVSGSTIANDGGAIVSAKDVALLAQDSIVNASGTIKAGGDIDLTALTGSGAEGRVMAERWIIDVARVDIAGQVVDLDGRSIGHDDALPHHQGAALPIRHHAVIAADQPRSLRDQQGTAGDAVVDVLGQRHLGMRARLVSMWYPESKRP
jgi:hypothetical protein